MKESIAARTALLKQGRLEEFYAFEQQEPLADRVAEVEDRADATDERIAAIEAGLIAAFEAAGKQAPAVLASETQRPDLRLIQGGAA